MSSQYADTRWTIEKGYFMMYPQFDLLNRFEIMVWNSTNLDVYYQTFHFQTMSYQSSRLNICTEISPEGTPTLT